MEDKDTNFPLLIRVGGPPLKKRKTNQYWSASWPVLLRVVTSTG